MFAKVVVICAFAFVASAYQIPYKGLEVPTYERSQYGMYYPWMMGSIGKDEVIDVPETPYYTVPYQYWWNKYNNPMMMSYYQTQSVPYGHQYPTGMGMMPSTVGYQQQMPYTYPFLNKMYGHKHMMMPYEMMMMQNYMMY